jgi:heptosyltransferase II
MKPPAILIVLPNWVGDGALAAPCVRAVQAARPDHRLILLGTARSAPLYGRWPSHALLQWEGSGLRGLLRVANRLRLLGAAEAIILAPSFRAALAVRLAGVGRRIGYATDSRRWLLSDALDLPGRDSHLALQYLSLAARGGADPATPPDPSIPIGNDERERAQARLRSLGLDASTTVALCPGATYGETKRWPIEHWTRLAAILVAGGDSVLVMGGADERAIAERICAAVGNVTNRVKSLAGELTLRESLAVLGAVAGAVSNDSGAMHLAAAAGCPVLGLFGSTNPRWTGPLGARSRAIGLGLDCAPCYAKRCPTQIECLRDLEPSRVAAAFRELRGGKEE